MIVETPRPGCFEDFKAILTAVWGRAGKNPTLDLGCGEAHVTKHFDGVYVDIVPRPTQPGKTMHFDILDAPERLKEFRFKLLVMADVIEHLKKFDGQQLLDRMALTCDAMFIFTPIGPYWTEANATHPDAHKSAWFPKGFDDAGWEVLAYNRYHIFSGSETLGAFFAWKFNHEPNPSVAEILRIAGITL